jgi:ATP-dependent DNA helicase DinG
MYATTVSYKDIRGYESMLKSVSYGDKKQMEMALSYYSAAAENSKTFFKYMNKSAVELTDECGDDSPYIRAYMGKQAKIALRAFHYSLERLIAILNDSNERQHQLEIKRLLGRFEQLSKKLDVLMRTGEIVYWLDQPDGGHDINPEETRVVAIPKDLDKQLFKDLWCKPFPKVLTSGTIAVGENFSFIKGHLGLDEVYDTGIYEATKESPFDYASKGLLYISENVPRPVVHGEDDIDDVLDFKDRQYITALSKEIKNLICASHGHTAVLFTSYRSMELVMLELCDKKMPYPMYKLSRGNITAIDAFKNSENGVLFAAGAFWEGIDLPGDILSSLIIVKLPFSAPDPISEYERTLYASESEFKDKYVFSDMIIKLKQGIGRLLRTETDTGVVSILDARMRHGGAYRDKVLNMLPDYPVTDRIEDVETFLKSQKQSEYYLDKKVIECPA